VTWEKQAEEAKEQRERERDYSILYTNNEATNITTTVILKLSCTRQARPSAAAVRAHEVCAVCIQ